jgi:phage internal scaffolding protein
MKIYVTKKSDIGKGGPGIYVLDTGNKRKRKVITVTDKDKIVEQSQAALTDIHKLLEPAIKNGLLRHATKYEGEMDDLLATDYTDAMNKVASANSMFEQLPGKVRARFDNNPAQFLDFVQNPNNADELKSMGLLKGNDGKLRDGSPSGAPTRTDHNADGIPDKTPTGEITPGQPNTKAEPPSA